MYKVNKWFDDMMILLNCYEIELFMIYLVYDEFELISCFVRLFYCYSFSLIYALLLHVELSKNLPFSERFSSDDLHFSAGL